MLRLPMMSDGCLLFVTLAGGGFHTVPPCALSALHGDGAADRPLKDQTVKRCNFVINFNFVKP